MRRPTLTIRPTPKNIACRLVASLVNRSTQQRTVSSATCLSTDLMAACFVDYIGADCKVSKYEPPTVSSLLTPTDCTVRNQTCSIARLRAENAASVPTLTCGVSVTLVSSSIVLSQEFLIQLRRNLEQ
jgi:hypothetical protein